MLQSFYPKEWKDSTYEIDFWALYQRGYRGVIFDIDNTLVEHGADATKEAIALLETLKQIGFEICLLSNNKKTRVERFNKDVHVNYIFQAQKPYSKNYYIATMMMCSKPEDTICIGDQVFTDVYGANRVGMYTILVKPIGKKEEFQVRLKRIPEKLVLYFYQKKKQRRERAKKKAKSFFYKTILKKREKKSNEKTK